MHSLANALVFASAITLLLGTSGHFDSPRVRVVGTRSPLPKRPGYPLQDNLKNESNRTDYNTVGPTHHVASVHPSGKDYIIQHWSSQWGCVRVDPKRLNGTLNRERLTGILLQALKRTIHAVAEEYVSRMKCFPK